MGFKHESKVLYLAAPFIKRTYPIWRYYQWSNLSGLALSLGTCVLGMALCRIGAALPAGPDPALPCQARAWRVGCAPVDGQCPGYAGATGLKDKTVVLLSNRHLALERYQTALLLDAARANRNGELEDALHNSAKDADYPAWNDQSLRNVVAAEAARNSGRTGTRAAGSLS